MAPTHHEYFTACDDRDELAEAVAANMPCIGWALKVSLHSQMMADYHRHNLVVGNVQYGTAQFDAETHTPGGDSRSFDVV